MLRAFLLLLLCLPAATARADAPLRVPGGALVAVARDALLEAARRDGIEVEIAPAGQPRDLLLAGSHEFELLPELPVDWLRARVSVPVRATGNSGAASRALVWFAVRAPVSARVYAQAYPRGTTLAGIALADGTVDRARMPRTAAAVVTTAGVAPQRLRRHVAAGQAALASDFEPLPAVAARQPVRIETEHGAVRLAIAGRALADGDIGDTISVLPAGAEQPVRARVISSQVVSVEN